MLLLKRTDIFTILSDRLLFIQLIVFFFFKFQNFQFKRIQDTIFLGHEKIFHNINICFFFVDNDNDKSRVFAMRTAQVCVATFDYLKQKCTTIVLPTQQCAYV